MTRDIININEIPKISLKHIRELKNLKVNDVAVKQLMSYYPMELVDQNETINLKYITNYCDAFDIKVIIACMFKNGNIFLPEKLYDKLHYPYLVAQLGIKENKILKY